MRVSHRKLNTVNCKPYTVYLPQRLGQVGDEVFGMFETD